MITNLFKNSKNAALDDLRAVVEQNKRDKEWLRALAAKATALDSDVHSARAALSNDPSDAAVEKLVEALRRQRVDGGNFELAAETAQSGLKKHKVERSLPAVRKALIEIIDRLEKERKVVLEKQSTSHSDLGVRYDPSACPINRAIDDRLRTAQSYLRNVEAGESGDIDSVISFCLS